MIDAAGGDFLTQPFQASSILPSPGSQCNFTPKLEVPNFFPAGFDMTNLWIYDMT